MAIAEPPMWTAVAVFSANDEHEPALLEIVAAGQAYIEARGALAQAADNEREASDHLLVVRGQLRDAQDQYQRARQAFFRVARTIPEADS